MMPIRCLDMRGLLHLAQLLQRFVSTPNRFEGIFAGFMLDDVPVGLAWAFAEGEDFFPVQLVFADDRFRAGAVWFDVDASRAARILFEHGDWISVAIGAIADIKL